MRIEGLPLYKAVDSGERFADVVVKVDYIPALVSDLVEALLEQGAEVTDVFYFPPRINIEVSEQGRYLVFRIEEEK